MLLMILLSLLGLHKVRIYNETFAYFLRIYKSAG